MDVRLVFFLFGFCFALCLAALFFHGVLEKVRDRSAKIDAVLKDNAQKMSQAQQKISELKIQYDAEIQRLVEEAEKKQLRDQVKELNDRVKK